jgi:protein gp37
MGLQVWGPTTTSARQPVKTVWRHVRRWNRLAEASRHRQKVFVMSLGDFFEAHPIAEAIRPDAWAAMRAAPWLDFQVLTKRPENIPTRLPRDWPWPHVWLGVSIENDRHVHRADLLRRVPAIVHFISAEPLLGPLPSLDLTDIEWLIVGGESGAKYRPMDLDWARTLQRACRASGTAFFFKQSAAPRTETGITLDGRLVRAFPKGLA